MPQIKKLLSSPKFSNQAHSHFKKVVHHQNQIIIINLYEINNHFQSHLTMLICFVFIIIIIIVIGNSIIFIHFSNIIRQVFHASRYIRNTNRDNPTKKESSHFFHPYLQELCFTALNDC